jgi:hypothetical protein
VGVPISRALAVPQALLANDTDRVGALLQSHGEDPEAAPFHAFIAALQAIVAGRRDPDLASSLDRDEAAEVLLLIEALEQHASWDFAELSARTQLHARGAP